MRSKGFPAVREPGDLNATFVPILEGQAWAELRPRVLSTDPWVVYFEEFMTEEETLALEAHMFAEERQFVRSGAGAHNAATEHRYSETAFCTEDCDQHHMVQKVRGRASALTGVPPENFDFMQSLRYREGMFYKAHHDNHPTFHLLPCGSRIYTWFVYMSDEGLEGGATYFPRLDIRAPAKRGAAVLFANTMDWSPLSTDSRTQHVAETVTKGEKRGLNMWLYQYDFRSFWKNGCTTIELADDLKKLGEGAAGPTLPIAQLQNPKDGKLGTVHVFAPATGGPERYVGPVSPGGSVLVAGPPGSVYRVFSEREGGEPVMEHAMTRKRGDRVVIARRAQRQEL